MDLKITLKPNNKYIINNSHNSVLNITHISKFSDKEKSILKLTTTNRESLPFAILQKTEFLQKANLYIFNDKDIKSNNYITLEGSPVDLYGIYEYEEIVNNDNTFQLISKEIDDKEKFKLKSKKKNEDEEEDLLKDINANDDKGIEELLLSKKRKLDDKDLIKVNKSEVKLTNLNKKNKNEGKEGKDKEKRNSFNNKK